MFKSAERAALQEIGPRFTLKLKYLKKGTPAVQQFGAAPPPLVFDDDDEGEEKKAEEEEQRAADEGGVDTRPLGDANEEEETSSAEGAAAPVIPSRQAGNPPKDEEYIWMWKVCSLMVLTHRMTLMPSMMLARAGDVAQDVLFVISPVVGL